MLKPGAFIVKSFHNLCPHAQVDIVADLQTDTNEQTGRKTGWKAIDENRNYYTNRQKHLMKHIHLSVRGKMTTQTNMYASNQPPQVN